MNDPIVLITCRQMQVELPRHRGRIEGLGYRVIAPDLGSRQQFTSAELLKYSEHLVGIIAGDDELNCEFFAGSPHLRTVIRWGIGLDSVDREAARQYGVSVRNTPGVFGQEVADQAFGYLLSLARGLIQVDAAVRHGEWPKFEGISLAGARLGVIGMGSIGREVARRGLGFDMEVVAFDPFVEVAPPGASMSDLNALLSTSRFVVVACPLTPDTFHLINGPRLALMRSDAYLVNVGRGPVVSEADLVTALQARRLAGAALDVYEAEPLPADSQLRRLSNVLLGAHNGSNTREGVVRASDRAVDFLVEELTK